MSVNVLSKWLASRLDERTRAINEQTFAGSLGFDFTPAELITVIIAPACIFKPKDLWKNRKLLGIAS